MGCMIKADENHRGTTRKVSRQSELLRSVFVHVASAFICALVCCFSYWFPWFYCFINHFVWICLPSVWPVVFGPKCMFVVANAILVVVVGDWRKTCAKSKSPYEDMYEEYVKRSRGPRRVLIYKKVKRKICANAIEIKKQEMPKETADEKNEEIIAEEKNEEIIADEKNEEIIADEKNESKKDIVETGLDKNNETVEEASTYESEEKQEEMKDEQADNSEEASNDHDEDKTRSADDDQNKKIAKEEEITRSSDDELNKRVEDFIARVNKRRWAEANSWLICSA